MLSSFGSRLSLIGHLYFFLFIAFATIFFRERVLVADAAFQIFDIIRTGDFGLYSNRFSGFIPQALPVAAVHAGLSLNAVLVLYSVAPVLVCYLCFCLVIYYLKDLKAGLAIILASCILLTEGFYFATFEVNQAVCVLIVAYSIMQQQGRFRMGDWVILGLSVVVALFFHPLALIGFVFLVGYSFLQNPAGKKVILISMLVLGGLLILIKTLFLTTAYESDKISLLGLYKVLTHFTRFTGPANFMRWLVQDYYLAIAFSLIILTVLFRQHKKVLAYWYVASAVGFWLLMVLANPDASPSIRYYLELHLQVLALIIAIPLVYEVLPAFFRTAWFPIALVLLLVSRFIIIYQHRNAFSDRLQWYDQIYSYTEGRPESRFLVELRNVPKLHAQNQLLWASSYESLLYFASQGKAVNKIIHLTDDASKLGYLLNEKGKVATTFEIFPDSTLPENYFKMTPSAYANLNTVSETNNLAPDLKITSEVEGIRVSASEKVIRIPINIDAENVIPSGLNSPKPYLLSYKLYKGNVEMAANVILTPLEVDIKGNYRQHLLIETPAKAGEYFIKPYLLPQDQNFWGHKLIKLTVK